MRTITILALALLASVAFANDLHRLKGLPPVDCVVMEGLDEESRTVFSDREEDVEKWCEMRMRRNGVKFASESVEGGPFVYLNLNIAGAAEASVIGFILTLQLNAPAILDHNGESTVGLVWIRGANGIDSPHEFEKYVRETLEVWLDLLSADILKAGQAESEKADNAAKPTGQDGNWWE